MPKLRVIQWNTGKVGKQALRAILADPRLELAGVFAYSADKVGRDAGVLCDQPVTTGIRATNDIEALLALRPDCALYAAQVPVVEELERLLAAGIDVVSTATFGRAGGLDSKIRARLEAACLRGQSSLFITGVNPGWVNGIIVAMTATCQRVERVRIQESANVSNYSSPETWLAHGMSLPASSPGIVENTRQSLLPFSDAVFTIAESLELKLDDVRFSAAHATAANDVDLGWMKIPRNTLAAVKATWSGYSRGRERIAISIAWRMTDELNGEWPMHEDQYELRIDGHPDLYSRIRWIPPTSGWIPTDWSILTALPAVNAVVPVHAARPGMLTLRDVGLPYSPVGLWT